MTWLVVTLDRISGACTAMAEGFGSALLVLRGRCVQCGEPAAIRYYGPQRIAMTRVFCEAHLPS